MKYIIELTNKQKAQMDCMIEIVHRYVEFNPKLEPIENSSESEVEKQQAYNKGVEDFEELLMYEDDYEQFFEDTYGSKDPAYDLYDLVAKYGAKKVVNDFNKWQEEKKKVEEEIKVGDEVKDLATNNIGVVLGAGERILYITKYDYVYSNTRGSLEKTGRHFDEIEQLLDKMKE